MSYNKETLTVLAGQLADALRSVIPQSGVGDMSIFGVNIALVPRNQLSISRRSRSAFVPVREVNGFWFSPIAVDGRILAFVGHLFRSTQPVEIVAERTELVLRGAGFRLCIKRLESAAPRAAESQTRAR